MALRAGTTENKLYGEDPVGQFIGGCEKLAGEVAYQYHHITTSADGGGIRPDQVLN